MGVTYVDVTVRNPAHRSRAWTGAFLVDTGAIDSLVPRRSLEAIGLSPTGRRTYVTADGREVEMDVTVGELEVMGALSGGVIVFGDEGAEPLLGVTALESAGIEVDPQNQRLKQLPAVRLRGFLGTRASRPHAGRRPAPGGCGRDARVPRGAHTLTLSLPAP